MDQERQPMDLLDVPRRRREAESDEIGPTRSYNEVKQPGDANSPYRSPRQSDLANFFDLVSAVEAWNPVATQLAVEQGDSLSENARTLALVNMAISDGL